MVQELASRAVHGPRACIARQCIVQEHALGHNRSTGRIQALYSQLQLRELPKRLFSQIFITSSITAHSSFELAYTTLDDQYCMWTSLFYLLNLSKVTKTP